MWRLGFVGFRLDREEGKTYSATAERECAKWQQATPEDLRLRSPR